MRVAKIVFQQPVKDKTKVELKAEGPKVTQIPPSASLPARDTIENTGSLNVHNYGLDENAIRKMFEEQEKKFEQLLESGSVNEEDKDLLKTQLSAVESKLANMKKALADRETVLAETEQALESEKLKNELY